MIDNGPKLWAKLIEVVGHGAVVAGGCIRDYMLGVPPKDIDLFIHGDKRTLRRLVENLNSDGLANLSMMNYEGGYESYDDPLTAVCEGDILGTPANIICNDRMIQGPDHLVEGFDFAITQGWWQPGMDEPRLTEAAQKDLADRTATLLTLRCYKRSLRRLDKYTVRNGPIITLVDPFQKSFTFT